MAAFVKLRPSTYVYIVVAILASAPAWIVKYPPLQDMPFHVAALRVIHSFGEAKFNFGRDYVLSLGQTQYVLYYIAGSLVAYLVGVSKANVVLLCCYLGGTPLAMRQLLRALGRDERLCLFTVPLLVNTMFTFGFMPFLFGIPIMILAAAAVVRHVEEPSLTSGAILAVFGILVFYSHIFPFAIFGLAYAALFPWARPSRWVAAAAPAMPSLLLLVWWTRFSEAGQQSSGALREALQGRPITESLPAVFPWITDVFRDSSDEMILVFFGALVLLSAGLSLGDADPAKTVARRFVLVPLACAAGYFCTGDHLGPVWLFRERFPILGLFMMVPVLRLPRGARGAAMTAAITSLGLFSTYNTCVHFIKFQLAEVGDLDEAIARMEPGRRVAALIYDRESAVMNWAPFLHFGSYYQVAKGGLIQFSYANWSHWPFHYKPGAMPPPGRAPRPRWEWTPEGVPVIGELYPYYDYVLTRGAGFSPPSGTFQLQYRGSRWSVWRRGEPSP